MKRWSTEVQYPAGCGQATAGDSVSIYISTLRLDLAPASWQRFTCESPSPHGSLLQDAQVCLAGPFVQPCWWWQPFKENEHRALGKCAAPKETQVKFAWDCCWKVLSGLCSPRVATSTFLNIFTLATVCASMHILLLWCWSQHLWLVERTCSLPLSSSCAGWHDVWVSFY